MKQNSRLKLTSSFVTSVGVAILLASCGGTPDAGGDAAAVVSCTNVVNSMPNLCLEHTRGFTPASVMTDCAQSGAAYVYSASACATANRIASCEIVQGDSAYTIYFYQPYNTVADARPRCDGTFTAL